MKAIATVFIGKKCSILFTLLMGLVLLSAGTGYGDVNIDIRSDGSLGSGESVAYVTTIDDCADVISVSVQAGDHQSTVAASEMTHVSGTTSAYQFSFNATGPDRYQPSVTVSFSDGSTQVHS